MALMFPIVMLVLNVSSVAVLWFGAQRVDAGSMQIGSLTAFLTYLMQILMSVMMATFLLMIAPRAAVCAERIGEVLDTDSSVVAARPAGDRRCRSRRSSSSTTPSSPTPAPSRRCCASISFTASAGPDDRHHRLHRCRQDHADLVDPAAVRRTAGSVLVDGVDVRDLDPELLWSRIGLVPQKPFLFSGTVASNLRYGNPDATDDELWQALRVAQAEDFVRAMPEQLEAPIAQGGTNVSGGQRQRLVDRPRPGQAARRSTSSTTRSRPWTWPPMRGSGRR